MASRKPANAKFILDFASLEVTRPTSRAAVTNSLDPPGFSASSYAPNANTKLLRSKGSAGHGGDDPNANLKMKKAWDVVLGAAKGIPMNAFMLWMAGSGVQIFSIMITAMMFFQPLKALQNVNTAFEKFEVTGPAKKHYSLLMPKLAFVAVQMVMLSIGIYKCSSMGLLPTATSDWLAFLEPKTVLEYSATT